MKYLALILGMLAVAAAEETGELPAKEPAESEAPAQESPEQQPAAEPQPEVPQPEQPKTEETPQANEQPEQQPPEKTPQPDEQPEEQPPEETPQSDQLQPASPVEVVPIDDLPYEEQEKHFPEQRIMSLVNSYDRFFVKKRNYGTDTELRCHSIKKESNLGEPQYSYKLSVRKGAEYEESEVTVTLWKSGEHKQYNAVNYTSAEGKEVSAKLMTENIRGTCFVFVQYADDNARHCDLLMRAGTLSGDIPVQCRTVYDSECTGSSIELFESSCRGH